MQLAAFQNEGHLAMECVCLCENTGDSTYKEIHLQKPSLGFGPGRNQALSSIPPITEQAKFRKNRVLHKYY